MFTTTQKVYKAPSHRKLVCGRCVCVALPHSGCGVWECGVGRDVPTRAVGPPMLSSLPNRQVHTSQVTATVARAGACHGRHSTLCSYPTIWVGRGANGCKSQTTFARHFLLVDTHGLTAERLSPTPRCPLTPGSFGVTQRRHGAPACVTAARLTATETSTVLLWAVGAGGCQGQYTRQVVSYITPLSVHDRCYYHVATLLCFPPPNTCAPLHQSAHSPIITHNLFGEVWVLWDRHTAVVVCGSVVRVKRANQCSSPTHVQFTAQKEGAQQPGSGGGGARASVPWPVLYAVQLPLHVGGARRKWL